MRGNELTTDRTARLSTFHKSLDPHALLLAVPPLLILPSLAE